MKEQELLACWSANATEWARAIEDDLIPSRRFTNKAIVNAVGPGHGRTILDLGCGEGWLSQRLHGVGWRVQGVDGVADLVDKARALGSGQFKVGTYDVLTNLFQPETFDAVVANFSLLGQDSTRAAIENSYQLLKPDGTLFVQTLHPEADQESGWQSEDWSGLGQLDCRPSPWYRHTLKTWRALFASRPWSNLAERPVFHHDSAVSLILIARR